MKIIRTKILLFVFVLVLAVFAGCNKQENEPMDILIDNGGTAIGDDGPQGVADPPVDEPGPAGQEGYYQAYLDILTENSSRLTSRDENAYFSDGKVAVKSVFGNETPELMYIYIPENEDASRYLAIYSYYVQGGPMLVFDSNVLTLAGGGGNYCVYTDIDGHLLLYRATYGAASSFGFWPVYANQNLEVVPDFGVDNFSADLSYLYSMTDHESGEALYMLLGEETSEKDFNTTLPDLMGYVDTVIFDSSDLGPDGEYGLYERSGPWMGITPFESAGMTYAEAVSWLEGQVG